MAVPEDFSPAVVSDPDALTKALELELMAKRISWQRAKNRHGLWRALSFVFLLLVVLGALLAYFYFSPQMHAPDEGQRPGATESSR
ncbi:MAG: hypothetical protein ACR2G0_02700 [Chthoniobacterales bacterium]